MADGLPRDVAWRALGALFARHGLVRHQVEAFDNFMLHLLPHVINEAPALRAVDEAHGEEHTITLCNVGVDRPTVSDADGADHALHPHQARMRGLTYASNVVVDVVHDVVANGVHSERRVYREVLLCSIPTMVGSACCHTQTTPSDHECRLDHGGYFIINGIEKALVSQERLRTNYPFVFRAGSQGKYQLVCEIRSCAESKLRSTSTLLIHLSNTKRGEMPQMTAVLPFMQQVSIPILALFRMLRVNTRADVVRLIVGDVEGPLTRLLCSILDHDATADMNTDDLFDWLGREGTVEPTHERRRRYLDHIVSNEFLPHMGLSNDDAMLHAKAVYIGFMVRRLLRVYVGELETDDRDHYAGKRIDPSGMGMLFRQLYRSMLKMATMQMHRLRDQGKLRFTNAATLIGGRRITNVIRHAFSTGTWGMQVQSRTAPSTQTGVAQMISRMSVVATLSSMRKINTPISREGKQPKPRQLHYTSWGVVCCVETPEGASCGLIKNLAMTAHLRVGSDSSQVRELLRTRCAERLCPLDAATDEHRGIGRLVLVNGILVGYVRSADDARWVARTMRELRRSQTIPFDTTVAHVDDIVVIDTDPGCLLRPLLVGARMHLTAEILESTANVHQQWDELLRQGVIEYVDKLEETELMVGLRCDRPDAAFTHYELHPSMILGLCASLIPFPDHNQAPRNTYQAAMGKQAIGINALNHAVRLDTIAHTLVEPQRPLVSTRVDRLIGVSDAPAGVNVMVAIMVRKGYNQEDSVLLSKAAVQRGLFRSVKYVTHRDEERTNGADCERFENPSTVSDIAGLRVGDYSQLEDSGALPVGATVHPGDAIIGKTVSTSSAEAIVRGTRQTTKNDKSVMAKNDVTIVDAVLRSTKPDGARMLKVRTRQTRSPMVGDKFSSRMGQKGVVGTLLEQEDLPYTADGMTPDLIMNPHAIPSRMTLGQLMECLLGKLSAVRGEQGDATAFEEEVTVDSIARALEREGFDAHGNEVMYDGCTGEPFETRVFLGPVYYQRLKHMSGDKCHARSRGPKQALTHQPLEGRARDGGLRFGEMERDCLISHGAADFLLDRLMLASDAFDAWLCGRCGNFALPPTQGSIVRNRRPFCRICRSSDACTKMCIPFACKLLLQELQGMHVGVRLLTDAAEEGAAAAEGAAQPAS